MREKTTMNDGTFHQDSHGYCSWRWSSAEISHMCWFCPSAVQVRKVWFPSFKGSLWAAEQYLRGHRPLDQLFEVWPLMDQHSADWTHPLFQRRWFAPMFVFRIRGMVKLRLNRRLLKKAFEFCLEPSCLLDLKPNGEESSGTHVNYKENVVTVLTRIASTYSLTSSVLLWPVWSVKLWSCAHTGETTVAFTW